VGLNVVNDSGTRCVRELRFTCDAKGCEAHTNDLEIEKAGGLLELGWHRQFNNEARRQEYFCPEHKEEHSGN
jgi:hypothetical protein